MERKTHMITSELMSSRKELQNMLQRNFSVLKVAVLEKVVAIAVFTCTCNSATATRIVTFKDFQILEEKNSSI